VRVGLSLGYMSILLYVYLLYMNINVHNKLYVVYHVMNTRV